jgi:outer membrane protein OmpA-like peptidoglycan-associated protein
MRQITFLFCLLITTCLARAQNADSVVTAQGKVVNAVTKEPVVAKIMYQSLPYGNKVGMINGNEYSFPMYDGERYSITVEAQGFATAKYMLNPSEATNNTVQKDIELHEAAAVAKKKNEVGSLVRLDNLQFEIAKAKISPESYQELDVLVSMLKENPKMVIQLEGHTDFLGNPEKNLKLSEQRVEAVKNYLTSKGVHKGRVKTKAFGGSQPLSRDNTPEAHARNRRVEMRIISN